MAAGRGQFFQSVRCAFRRSLMSVAQQKAPEDEHGDGAAPWKENTEPGAGQEPGPFRRESPTRISGDLLGAMSLGGKETSKGATGKSILEKLPSEMLLKVLSFLDAASLLCLGQVNKLFHHLANDKSEFGGKTWKVKFGECSQEYGGEFGSAHCWKKAFMRQMSGLDQCWCSKELKTSRGPFTGVSLQTEAVLRRLNVSWDLLVGDQLGQKLRLPPSHTTFFTRQSVMVRWSGAGLPSFLDIRSIELHGLRKEEPHWNNHGWWSLMMRLDVEEGSWQDLAHSGVIDLKRLPHGFLVGVWKGQTGVAFIQTSLHFHQLVERSLLGSPVCCFSEPVEPLLMESTDDKQNFSVSLCLHSTTALILSSQLGPAPALVRDGVLELRVIQQHHHNQHLLLSGHLQVQWQSDGQHGWVEDCCFMTLTVSDGGNGPRWCVSELVRLTQEEAEPYLGYYNRSYGMQHSGAGGRVEMKLVQVSGRHKFLVSLTVYLPLV